MLRLLTCLKCGWQWYTRAEHDPGTCPRASCRSRTWNKPDTRRRIRKKNG